MVQYINKDTLEAEIKRRIKEIEEIGTYLSPKGTLTNLLCFLNTLEVKDVNLNEEINKWIEDNTCRGYCSADIHETAEHFFELGTKATQKGE